MMHPFRTAIESGETESIIELFAPDVVFNSPVVFRPYHGREALTVLLRAVARVFEDFRYEREIGADGDRDHALVFGRGWVIVRFRGATSSTATRMD